MAKIANMTPITTTMDTPTVPPTVSDKLFDGEEYWLILSQVSKENYLKKSSK